MKTRVRLLPLILVLSGFVAGLHGRDADSFPAARHPPAAHRDRGGVRGSSRGKPKNAHVHPPSTVTAAASPSPSPTPEAASDLRPGEWQAFVDPERQIFPSLLLASATLNGSIRDGEDNEAATGNHSNQKKGKDGAATKGKGKASNKDRPAPSSTPAPEKETVTILGERNGLIGVSIASPAAGTRVELEVKENAFMETSTLAVTLPEAGEEYHLLPKINYRYDALNIVRQSRPVNVVYTLKIDGKDAGQQIVTARVRPINDCPFAYQDPDGEESDYMNISWMFAAYVNEDDPAIAGLLKEAQETGAVDGFDAYQSHEPARILLQVFAVWAALQKHGIKYSDIGTTATGSDALYTMHVRFIEEALAETHANCVDASLLLASVLRRMGIDPFLLIEPDHMFLGFYLDAEGKDFACLETTMLGDADPKEYKTHRLLARYAPKGVKKMKGWACFNQALDDAQHEYQQNKKKFGSDDQPQYSIVDIAAARHEGIAPIAYVKGE